MSKTRRAQVWERTIFESFITAFVIYFLVIDPVSNALIFLATTDSQDRTWKLQTGLFGGTIATAILLFFSVCGAWIRGDLNITKAAFKIASGIKLCLTILAKDCWREDHHCVLAHHRHHSC